MNSQPRGHEDAADRALEQALDRTEPDGVLWFLLYPTPDLLQRHARRRASHAVLIDQILALLRARNGNTARAAIGAQDGWHNR